MNNSYEILEILLKYIQKKGLTEKQCLINCNINTSFLTDWKKGRLKTPSYDKVLKLAEYLNIDFNLLFSGNKESVDVSLLADDEQELLAVYNSLSDIGKARLKERADALADFEKSAVQKHNRPENNINIQTVRVSARSFDNSPPRMVTGDFSDVLNAPDNTDEY